jgi:hypothetical protein
MRYVVPIEHHMHARISRNTLLWQTTRSSWRWNRKGTGCRERNWVGAVDGKCVCLGNFGCLNRNLKQCIE